MPVTDLCYDYRTQLRLDSLVRVIAQKNMLFAQRIHSRNLGCTFYPDARAGRFDLHISWESTGRNPYWLTGTMQLGEGDWRWTPGTASPSLTEVNRNWDDVTFLGELFVGGAAAIAAASSARSDAVVAQKSGYAVVCFWNKTPHILNLHTRWLDGSEWTTQSVLSEEGLRLWSESRDTLVVQMDVALDETRDQQTFLLPARRQSTGPAECAESLNYDFVVNGNTVEMKMP